MITTAGPAVLLTRSMGAFLRPIGCAAPDGLLSTLLTNLYPNEVHT
jgi:hypothetical protein